MNPQISNQKISHWLNQNRKHLFQYRQQYIAYSACELLAHGKQLQDVLNEAEAKEQDFAIYYVPEHLGATFIYPIRLRSISRHEWLPNYRVHLRHGECNIPATMLVDSGADFSVINWKTGQELGYALADSEQMLLAYGIGGSVDYVLRRIHMNLDGHDFLVPVAWLQDDSVEEMILGREVLFDLFNIEFRQADERILFTWRENS